ncbi:uncharacterized protein KY384_000417 [Bacidia gigantensis]|uniref:uncharacterized protein n=1 Tax=Bacidia gigantensis TaxID=2732470 RepID=UPI001D0442F3|nr:uncharacterized protein KY384_000417 [Bacidia gigantensis]KAG8525657.1 hypothetical protein KY384_000417 [Bacidia gigantensis]
MKGPIRSGEKIEARGQTKALRPRQASNSSVTCFGPPDYFNTLNGAGGNFNVCGGVSNILDTAQHRDVLHGYSGDSAETDFASGDTVSIGELSNEFSPVEEWKDPNQPCTLSLRCDEISNQDEFRITDIQSAMNSILGNCSDPENAGSGYGGKTKLGSKGFWVYLYGYDKSHC